MSALSLMLASTTILNAQCACNLSTCNGGVFTEDYNNPAIWTPVLTTPGSMTVASSTMNYVSTPGGNTNRMYASAPSLSVNSLAFYADCKVAVGSGNSPGHYVMAFTTSNADPISGGPPSYTLTNNDGIFIYLLSPNTPGSGTCCTNPYDVTNPWQFVLRAKDGTVLGAPSTGISMVAGVPIYYVRMVRAKCRAYLAVFSDASFTTHIPGSPVCITIPETSTNYNFAQHGVITWGSNYRKLNMKVDNLRVCSYINGCSFIPCRMGNPEDFTYASETYDNEASMQRVYKTDDRSDVLITPNPSTGIVNIGLPSTTEKIKMIVIRDISGRTVFTKSLSDNDDGSTYEIDLREFSNGTYLVEVNSSLKVRNSKLTIEK